MAFVSQRKQSPGLQGSKYQPGEEWQRGQAHKEGGMTRAGLVTQSTEPTGEERRDHISVVDCHGLVVGGEYTHHKPDLMWWQ